MASPGPKFVSRDRCIACRSGELTELAGGHFRDEPLGSFIAGDPWGENPLPILADERWSLVRCNCGQAFHRFILSPKWNAIRFSQWMSEDAIREFEEVHGSGSDAAAHVQHVLRLQKLGVRTLLDFGCGFGKFVEMCQLFGLDAVGVDRSSARQSGASVRVHAELEDVPGSFDAITMFEVLEHLDDPLAMLRTLKRRLNPGGLMVIEVPDTSGVSGIQSREDYYKVHPLDHINAFTPESLARIMSVAGFEPLPRIPAFVTTSLLRVAKDIARERLKPPTTQRYFRLRAAPNDMGS
jgi:SAM-dependent methyltransferase